MNAVTLWDLQIHSRHLADSNDEPCSGCYFDRQETWITPHSICVFIATRNGAPMRVVR